MSYVYLPGFFWEYALVIVQDIMNLVASKVVSTTPNELWTEHKTRTCSDLGKSSTRAEKRSQKLEARSHVYLFEEYPKRTEGYLFYDPQD